jgi:hypothetical protein
MYSNITPGPPPGLMDGGHHRRGRHTHRHLHGYPV